MTIILNGTTGVTFPNGVTMSDGTSAPVTVAQGGTGANTASAARTALGVAIGTDVLAPNGSGANLTSLNATSISAGTVAAARLPSSGVNAASITTGTLAVANGGTGTATPSLVGGTNITISGSWPNQTVTAAGGGVTSLNGQTGAITNTSSQSIGSYICCYFNIGSQSVGQVNHGNTYAGSSAYRFRYFTDNGSYGMFFAGQVYTNISGCTYIYQPVWKSNTSSSQITGLSLSGTWRLLSYVVSDNNYDSGFVAFGMFVRVS